MQHLLLLKEHAVTVERKLKQRDISSRTKFSVKGHFPQHTQGLRERFKLKRTLKDCFRIAFFGKEKFKKVMAVQAPLVSFHEEKHI